MPDPADRLALIEQLRRPLAELPDPLPIPTLDPSAPFDLTLRPPGSKSLTNRALLLAALADGRSTLRHPLTGADDAERMLAALAELGVEVRREPEAVRLRGVAGRWPGAAGGEGPRTLFLNNAGTATRFLAAAALLSPSPITIDGNARMRQRPIGELGDALRALGAQVRHEREDGYPPITVSAPAWIADPARFPPPFPSDGSTLLEFGRTQSSQFISALLLVAPFLPGGLALRLREPTSPSYIRMTVALLRRAGADVGAEPDLSVIRVRPGSGGRADRVLPGLDLDVEPDASSATYFWAAAALFPGSRTTIAGLRPPASSENLQGDADFPRLLEAMGCRTGSPGAGGAGKEAGSTVLGPDRLRPLRADMTDMPDATMTLGVCCAFAGGLSVLKGVRTLRVKETDRIAALQAELGKVGVVIEDDLGGDPDAMSILAPERGIDTGPGVPPVAFQTYDDHRMAMSLALVGLRRPGVWIEDPKCVAKTYPTFFSDLAALYRR